MRKYFIFFSNYEAFLKFQYICTNLRRGNNIYVLNADYYEKNINLIYLKKDDAISIMNLVNKLIKEDDELFILDLKNKSNIEIDFYSLYELISSKKHKYIESPLYSCNHERLRLSISSLFTENARIFEKDLVSIVAESEKKRNSMEYLKYVSESINITIDNNTLYELLYLVYIINNTENEKTKSIFYHQKESDIVIFLDNYKMIIQKLDNLYKKGIITYPFNEDCEIIKNNAILPEEKDLTTRLTKESQKIQIHERNSIYIHDIAYLYHLEDEDRNNFDLVLTLLLSKNLIMNIDGKICLSRLGENLYKSILNKDLENYLQKGF